MKEDLDKALCAKYPKIFKNRYGDPSQSAICWGLCIGDGWYQIINTLCNQIQHHIDTVRTIRARALKYNRALRRAIRGDIAGLENYYKFDGKIPQWAHKRIQDDIENASFRCFDKPAVKQLVAVQIKEKFGTLRFYCDGGDDVTDGMIRMAEAWSAHTCEECGNVGKTRDTGWIRILCDEHANLKK